MSGRNRAQSEAYQERRGHSHQSRLPQSPISQRFSVSTAVLRNKHHEEATVTNVVFSINSIDFFQNVINKTIFNCIFSMSLVAVKGVIYVSVLEVKLFVLQ